MKKSKRTNIAAGFLMIVFVIVFLILASRFLYIQMVGEIDGVDLDKWAEHKYETSHVLPASRGSIKGQNGEVLAYNRPIFQMYAILDKDYSPNSDKPMYVKDINQTAEKLAPLLDMDEQKLYDILKKGKEKGLFQVEFGKYGDNLSKKTKDKIEDLDLTGLYFNEDKTRYYPNGMFATRVVGLAQKGSEDEDSIIGINGIENTLNDQLIGHDGHISYDKDLYGVMLPDPNEIIEKPKDGNDVYLTIDRKIQTVLEDTMSQVYEKFKPERMSGIVMNPKTGEIMAMTNRPNYDPNNPSNVKNWYNDIVSTPIEPGSTMKIFTWAAAIDSGVYQGDKWLKPGTFKVTPKSPAIHDWTQRWDSITFDQGFIRSSNVAAAKLAWEEMGPDKYLSYLKAFDFDKPTGIDLPQEQQGEILFRYPIGKVTTAFGQGTTITPIQELKAATAIANDGKMMKPYIVSEIVDSETGDIVEETEPEVVGQPISKSTAKQMRDLMEGVVQDENGTGSNYRLEEYNVIGKTGTSQIPNPNGGGYLQGDKNYIFSFLGMAPKDDPELLVYVSVKQPELMIKHNRTGSSIVSQVFNNVMKSSLQYLHIEPETEISKHVQDVKIPQLIDQDVEAVKDRLEDKGFNISVIGDGNIIKVANVEKGDTVLPPTRIILVTDKAKMPDITGWSKRDVLQLSKLLSLDVETLGEGYVVKQSIDKGVKLKAGDYLGIELASPIDIYNEKQTVKEKEDKKKEETDMSNQKEEERD